MKHQKIVALFLSALLILICLTSALAESEPSEAAKAYATPRYKWDFFYSIDDTKEIRNTAVEQQGTVEELTYECPAYAYNEILGVDETASKRLLVYLPYNYDPSLQYNILYLMHGGGETENFWLGTGERCHGEADCNLLDYMIMNGLCDPCIVVAPTFYTRVEGLEVTDAQAKSFAAELGDENLGSEEALHTWFFQYELRNDIIPLVESRYSTYAGGDTGAESLKASREHRAYAGLSMGSITSFHSILMGNLDIMAYVGSFSGCKTDYELFKKILQEKFADQPIRFWYNGNGFLDQALEEHVEFYNTATLDLADRFTDGENCAMVVMPNGKHSWTAWVTDLYNALLVFFK